MKLIELVDILGIDILHAIAWTLVHSLWQASLLVVGVMICMAFTRSSQAELRHTIITLGMGLGWGWSIATFFAHFQKSVLTVRFSEQSGVTTIIPIHDELDFFANVSLLVNQHLSLLVLSWCLGFAAISGVTIYAWLLGRNLIKQGTDALSKEWEEKFNILARQLGIHKKLTFLLSNKIYVPCVVGYIKPVILLPASLMLGMSPQQVEVIVLHELAHIRRHDVLAAYLQSLTKAAYFFNPWMLWMSMKLDQERENACDDLAVRVCQNPLLYAQTLHHYAEMHTHFLSTTTSLIGRKNMLKHRIQRLFQSQKTHTSNGKKLMSMIMLFSLGLSTAAFAWMQLDKRTNFNLSAKNMPISSVLKQAEQACPGSTKQIQLRQPEQAITLSFSNLACADVPAIFVDIEERFGMKFTKVQFSEALKVFQQQCPAVFRDVRLKNPTALYSVNLIDVTCLDVLNSVATFDAKPDLQSAE